MHRQSINKAQTELEGLLAHGVSEIEFINSFGGDCAAAAQAVSDYADELGFDIDKSNMEEYFKYCLED